MKSTPLHSIFLAVFMSFVVSDEASAAPLFWESDFGDELVDITGEDDSDTDVTLSFPFPFEGTTYTTVHVGTNGGLQLGGLGDDDDIDYDNWENLDDFYDDGGFPTRFPTIFPFNTDTDLSTTGTIHFKDFGNRAVFTWNEVGTHEEEEHLCSFQVQLLADGRIFFSYNGILDGLDEDLITSLSAGILVGISGSTGTDPGPSDLSTPVTTLTDTLYEVWNYEDAPANDLFDLDMKTLVFVPIPGGGFSVSFMTGPALPDLQIGKSFSKLKGANVYNRRKASKKQTLNNPARIFTTNTAKAALSLQNNGNSAASFTLRSTGDTLPRMKVNVRANGANISAAFKAGRFSPTVEPGASVRVSYELTTDRFYAGVLRNGDRDDTINFRLSGAGVTDNASMVVRYRGPAGGSNL